MAKSFAFLHVHMPNAPKWSHACDRCAVQRRSGDMPPTRKGFQGRHQTVVVSRQPPVLHKHHCAHSLLRPRVYVLEILCYVLKQAAAQSFLNPAYKRLV